MLHSLDESAAAPPGNPAARVRSKKNWEDKLAELVAPHLAQLTEVAERILGTGEQADDAVQEALVTLWNTRDLPPNPRSWLVRTVVHRSLHARRTAERRRKWEERAGFDWALTCPLCDPSETLEAQELEQRLERALAGLRDDQRIVVALRAEGLDYQEIADRLEIPIGTVRSRLNRAREALRTRFDEGRSRE